jgi:hypothetical protein
MPQRFSTEDDAFTEDVAEQLRKSLPATACLSSKMSVSRSERPWCVTRTVKSSLPSASPTRPTRTHLLPKENDVSGIKATVYVDDENLEEVEELLQSAGIMYYQTARG